MKKNQTGREAEIAKEMVLNKKYILQTTPYDCDRIKDNWFSKSIHKPSQSPLLFAKAFGKTPKEAEENAQRIVKVVNMNNELIDKLKKLLSLYTATDHPSPRIVFEVQTLLQQAEQK